MIFKVLYNPTHSKILWTFRRRKFFQLMNYEHNLSKNIICIFQYHISYQLRNTVRCLNGSTAGRIKHSLMHMHLCAREKTVNSKQHKILLAKNSQEVAVIAELVMLFALSPLQQNSKIFNNTSRSDFILVFPVWIQI